MDRGDVCYTVGVVEIFLWMFTLYTIKMHYDLNPL